MLKDNRKILVLGIDGMDPQWTRRLVDEGRMPNTKKFLELGSARADLKMLGGHPCITPPMWTTLSTGCYANVHGITDFYRVDHELGYEYNAYNLNSKNCKAEPMWNVLAEAGCKTLVYTWPGSSWPPTSDSPNLHVIDGTTPEMVNEGIAQKEKEFILTASVKNTELSYQPAAGVNGEIPCVITDLKVNDSAKAMGGSISKMRDVKISDGQEVSVPANYMVPLVPEEATADLSCLPFDVVYSPLKEATGWINAPKDAREFVILLSTGFIRRPSLLLKNEAGVYDTVAVYKSKKDAEPFLTLKKGEYQADIIDDCIKEDEHFQVSRTMKVLDIDEQGESLRMWISSAMELDNDTLWHPQYLYKKVVENVGLPKPGSVLGGGSLELLECLKLSWDLHCKFEADTLKYLIEEEQYDVVFSQLHNIDAQGHRCMQQMKHRENAPLTEEEYQEFMERVYCEQTDWYIGQFLPLLDQGWAILIVSDHAAVTSEHARPLFPGAGLLCELGYTVLKKDENGQLMHGIDWSKTKAVVFGQNNIYINLKGREPNGIVDPSEKYALEEEIMTALYGYKHPKTGYRVVSVALRNRDAVLLGYGGPECGDICFWSAENYNADHGDSLATTEGYANTSVGPIFMAAGAGFKKNHVTERIIRQVDVTPTIAALSGVRMPNECEGAPVYQILDLT